MSVIFTPVRSQTATPANHEGCYDFFFFLQTLSSRFQNTSLFLCSSKMLSHLIKTTATTTKNLQRKSLSFIYRCFDIIYQATECIVPSFVYSHIYFNISLFILPSSIINQLVLREDVQFLYGENLTISEQQKRLGKKGLSGEEGGRGACVQRQGAAVRSR